MLVAENVKALRKLLPVLEAEYGKAGGTSATHSFLIANTGAYHRIGKGI